MLEIIFSKAGTEDIILTEDDLHDWSIRQKCFDNTFELGGVCAAELYLLIDNADMFARNAFANTTITVRADGELLGVFTPELPKRRDGIVEITAYDDMVKLDEEYKQEEEFPIIFWNAYKGIAAKIGITKENIIYDDVNGESGGLGFLNQDFETLMPAQSYRNVLAGMAQFNGSFATITPDKKLLIKAFGKTVVREFFSPDLLDYDYSDETITFSKIIIEVAKSRKFEGGGRVEKGDDTGYTLVLDRPYINGGLTQENYMQLIDWIWEYYEGFTLTPMELTLPEPDYSLRLGDRIRLYVAADDVTVEGNISAIEYTDSPVAQIITCGGFGGSGTSSLFTDSKSTLNTQSINQANTSVGEWTDDEHTSEIFNSYVDNAVEGISSKRNVCDTPFSTVIGRDNVLSYNTNFQYYKAAYFESTKVIGKGNEIYNSGNRFIIGNNNKVCEKDGKFYFISYESGLILGSGNELGNESNCNSLDYDYGGHFTGSIIGDENKFNDIEDCYIYGSQNATNVSFKVPSVDTSWAELSDKSDIIYPLENCFVSGNMNAFQIASERIIGKNKYLYQNISCQDNSIYGNRNSISGYNSFIFGERNSITLPYRYRLTDETNIPSIDTGYYYNYALGYANTINIHNNSTVVGQGNKLLSNTDSNGDYNYSNWGYDNFVAGFNNTIYRGIHDIVVGCYNSFDKTYAGQQNNVFGQYNKITQGDYGRFNTIIGRNNECNGNWNTIIGVENKINDGDTRNTTYVGYKLQPLTGRKIFAAGTYVVSKVGDGFVNAFELDELGNGYIAGAKILTEASSTASIMSTSNSVTQDLESRISALEKQVAELTALLQKGQTNA